MYAPYGPYFAYIAELLPARGRPVVALDQLVRCARRVPGTTSLAGWTTRPAVRGASFLMLAASLAAGAALMPLVRSPEALRVATARFQR